MIGMRILGGKCLKTTKLTPDRTNFETIGLVTWSNAINRFTPFIWVFGGDVLAEDGPLFSWINLAPLPLWNS